MVALGPVGAWGTGWYLLVGGTEGIKIRKEGGRRMDWEMCPVCEMRDQMVVGKGSEIGCRIMHALIELTGPAQVGGSTGLGVAAASGDMEHRAEA